MKILFSILTVCLMITGVHAQNGEALFKAKCNTCHLVDKNSTGPVLKGVKQKWEDAGEAPLLYEWVQNPQNLIASGKSKMAVEIKSFSPTDMTPQQVSNEDIDAILSYIDNYTVQPPPIDDTQATSPELKPDYEQNLTIFYALLTVILIILIGILVVSGSITTLIKSDYFKEKITEINAKGTKTLLILIGFFLFVGTQNNSYALSLAEQGEEAPWLKVEKVDIYILLGIIGLLLLVFFHIKKMFNQFIQMTKAENELIPVVKESSVTKINKVLTDAVPIEEEHTILMQHEYDGIRELDNNLPPWWLWGFYATIVFAVVYLMNYHLLGTSDLQIEAYNKDIKRNEAEVKAYLAKMAMNVDEHTATLLTADSDLQAGKSLFAANCVACHSEKGEGKIGPNLTDKKWIYGFDVKTVFKTVKLGTPNGMPEHSSKLNPVQIQQVASYILNLPETSGKEAEGNIVEE